jgi:hypothetical protein
VTGAKKKHDHRQSLWLIAGGRLCWCYQCGAWRPNTPGKMQWYKPTGIGGPNPAMEDVKQRKTNGKV